MTTPTDASRARGRDGRTAGTRARRAGALLTAVCAAVAALAATAPAAHGALVPRESVAAAGTAGFYGSTGNTLLNRPITDITPTPDGRGYWLLAGDGGVFSYGNAGFHGSTGGMVLNRPATRMAATRSGRGYWFVASDGGVFAFGDARFHGSMGGRPLNAPVVGVIPTSSGRGYWLVAADGGVFSFGDAGFRGSLGGRAISAPIVALAPTTTNEGYWLLGRDGAVYAFGDAPYFGGSHFVTGLATDIAAVPDGSGYVILDETGGVWSHRSSRSRTPRSRAPVPRGNPHAGAVAVGIAFTPDGNGTWIAWSGRARDPRIDTAQGAFVAIGGMDWSRCRGVTWRFDPRDAPPGALALYEELFDYASRATGMAFAYGGTVGDDAVPPDTIVAGWQDLGPLDPDPRDDLVPFGLTIPHPPNRAWVWLTTHVGIPLPPGGAHDWGRLGWGQIAIHELGHALGLDHHDDAASIMPPDGGLLLRWGDGDLAGIRAATAC